MKRWTAATVTGIAALTLAACGGGGGGSTQPRTVVDTDYAAIVQTVAADYQSSDVEVVDLEATVWTAQSGYATIAASDYLIDAFGEHFYHIGRLGIDSVEKRSIRNPLLSEWEYSVNEADAASGNPYQLVFKSAERAYLIRWANPEAWELNLDAGSESALKVSSIDLSPYDDGDGSPEATAGVVVGNRLYVVMQRLDASWVPGTAYIAAFDTGTNQEIDLNVDDSALKGIPLQTRNPQRIHYVEGLGLVVFSVGQYSPKTFNGGIEVVSLTDYSSRLLVDDGDPEEGGYGQISNGVVLSAQVGYFVAYAGWGNTAVYRFNPTTGVVADAPLAGLSGVDVRTLELDPEGRLWVALADSSNPRLRVLNTADDSLVTEVPTLRNPVDIAFTAVQ